MAGTPSDSAVAGFAEPGGPAFDAAHRVIAAIEAAGFEAWMVGGCVRDMLLGRPCNDIDITTSADWKDVQAVCERAGMRTHETGTQHGTITVVNGSDAFEVTTYRSDGAYDDARHPNQVTFVRTIQEDLARRDFTMNALAYHPHRGLVDPYGGKADMQARVIRAVGDPRKRFSEDALRILRACRFAAELGYDIDPVTYDGMLRSKGQLARISAERVTHELERLLLGPYAGQALMRTVDALAAVLPELVAMKGFKQHTPYHVYDVLEHTAHVVDGVPPYPLVRWAALFHDMGKPATFFFDEAGVGHFYDHASVSVTMARGVMERLTFSQSFIARALTLVEHHDDDIDPTPRMVKRAIGRLGGDPALFRALCDLQRGDALGHAPEFREYAERADRLTDVLDEVLAADEAFSLRDLKIDGRDVMNAGIAQGPLVGKALQAALDAVIDERVPNDPEALKAFVRSWAHRTA